jgi:cell division protein DivIC
MKLRELKKNKWFAFFSNKYVIILIIFTVWMIFFDANSLLTQRKLQKEIETLKRQKQYLIQELAKDKELLRKLKNEVQLERFARETYYMKKANEDIYLIEFEDSLKTNK